MQKQQAATKQNNTVKSAVIKGSQNFSEDANVDANMMARIQLEKQKQSQQHKKDKIEAFMNNTKLNASKLQKQQLNKQNTEINSKKALLNKQKDIKNKYTVVKKVQKVQKSYKEEAVKNICVEPVKVQWKKADIVEVRVNERNEFSDDDNDSAYDSEVDPEKNETPKQAIQFKQKIRAMMQNKTKRS